MVLGIPYCSESRNMSLLVLEKRSNSDTINGTKLASSSYGKLLSILTDDELSFDNHIKSFCREAGQKLNSLAWISIRILRAIKNFFLIQSLNLRSVIIC